MEEKRVIWDLLFQEGNQFMKEMLQIGLIRDVFIYKNYFHVVAAGYWRVYAIFDPNKTLNIAIQCKTRIYDSVFLAYFYFL